MTKIEALRRIATELVNMEIKADMSEERAVERARRVSFSDDPRETKPLADALTMLQLANELEGLEVAGKIVEFRGHLVSESRATGEG